MMIGVCVTVCVTTDPDFVITRTVVSGVGVGELELDAELGERELELGLELGMELDVGESWRNCKSVNVHSIGSIKHDKTIDDGM